MTATPQGSQDDGIVEFDQVTEGADGTWSARHKPSGEKISADSRERLETRATAKRVGFSLRQAFRSQERET